MSSAPSVNQMRFFSSSALANAEKLRLAASCSAAETMQAPAATYERPPHAPYGDQAAFSPSAGFGGARILTEPPAFSTAAIADLEAPTTSNATLALISPPPSNRTPSLARCSSPALIKVSAFTTELASSSPP